MKVNVKICFVIFPLKRDIDEEGDMAPLDFTLAASQNPLGQATTTGTPSSSLVQLPTTGALSSSSGSSIGPISTSSSGVHSSTTGQSSSGSLSAMVTSSSDQSSVGSSGGSQCSSPLDSSSTTRSSADQIPLMPLGQLQSSSDPIQVGPPSVGGSSTTGPLAGINTSSYLGSGDATSQVSHQSVLFSSGDDNNVVGPVLQTDDNRLQISTTQDTSSDLSTTCMPPPSQLVTSQLIASRSGSQRSVISTPGYDDSVVSPVLGSVSSVASPLSGSQSSVVGTLSGSQLSVGAAITGCAQSVVSPPSVHQSAIPTPSSPLISGGSPASHQSPVDTQSPIPAASGQQTEGIVPAVPTGQGARRKVYSVSASYVPPDTATHDYKTHSDR